jgi:NRAMP (natural resistance-associated macrophage protein)-like metal ion transporter
LGIPLIAGVILTAFDTLLFLVVQRFGIRKLEAFVFVLLFIVTFCFVVELFLCKPDASDLFQGFIPRINSRSLYDALGMLGVN